MEAINAHVIDVHIMWVSNYKKLITVLLIFIAQLSNEYKFSIAQKVQIGCLLLDTKVITLQLHMHVVNRRAESQSRSIILLYLYM